MLINYQKKLYSFCYSEQLGTMLIIVMIKTKKFRVRVIMVFLRNKYVSTEQIKLCERTEIET